MNEAIAVCLITALATVLLDTVVGILVSFKKGDFSISKLPQFLAKNVLPYIGGLIILAGFAIMVPELEYAFYAMAGLVALKFSKEAMVDKIKALFE